MNLLDNCAFTPRASKAVGDCEQRRATKATKEMSDQTLVVSAAKH